MKEEILEKFRKIEQTAKQTGVKGRLELHYDGIDVYEWDAMIESITEYPRLDHLFTVSEGVTVYLLLN